jgi:[methyl-Co(III) methanol-specific corrinoid protein]:coenzyme M methyltransferase
LDKPKEVFLKALSRNNTLRPATGSATSIVTIDLMKKAGISFPDAHLDSEKMAGLAAAGYTEIGFDNVMPLFSVWHESAAMGCKVDWGQVDRMPNCRTHLYKIGDTITIPKDLLNRPGCKIPVEALKILKRRHGNEVAILGKVFGPWTLGYHMFGVEEFLINTLLKPDIVKRAMDTLKEVTIKFGAAQIEAGADALCFADHATRDLCSPDAYRDFLIEVHQEINEKLACPLVLHICGDTSDRIPYINQTGIACFHFDSKVPSKAARELAGDKLSLMGGTSNFNVIRNGSAGTIQNDVEEKINCNIDIIGPECAVPLDAPFENMKILADEVKKRQSTNQERF